MKPSANELTVTLQPFTAPDAIERESFAIIERELGPDFPFSGDAWIIARRLVHTSADYGILENLSIPEEAVQAGVSALLHGRPVFTDTEMARAGMPMRRLQPLGVTVACMHTQAGVAEYAAEKGITRARAGVECAGERLAGSIVAVGNAPTALLALLDNLQHGGALPALVIAMPVGFVNAAESKALFLKQAAVPCIALKGRRGGSPLAAACVNALAELALRERAAGTV